MINYECGSLRRFTDRCLTFTGDIELPGSKLEISPLFIFSKLYYGSNYFRP